VDPHLKSATNEQLYRWQWRKVRVYEAARRMLVEAISSSKTAGAWCQCTLCLRACVAARLFLFAWLYIRVLLLLDVCL
jgi:hypothetical protein